MNNNNISDAILRIECLLDKSEKQLLSILNIIKEFEIEEQKIVAGINDHIS